MDVAPGFANNYLYPNKIAIPATKGNLKQLEQRKHNIAAREENRIAEANASKAALDALTVKVEARVGEEGVLFGSVTAAQIAEALKAQADMEIDRRRIEIKLLSRPQVSTPFRFPCTAISRLISPFSLETRPPSTLPLRKRLPRKPPKRLLPRKPLSNAE